MAISGGGAGGAFTVGVLNAWTEAGQRPEFDIVSGVSTGALIAPFAFLGPQYDQELRELYTSGVAAQLVERRFILSGIFGESFLKQEPLRRMVERYVTAAMLRAIAAEYRKGRYLFVLTTNLDTQAAVVWDLGAIASSGRPDSLALFRDVLIASASIPGVFPAVRIKAVVDGKQIEELHSDGGTSNQILTLPDAFLSREGISRPGRARSFEIYLLINNTLGPEFQLTESTTLSVAVRAYAALVKSQTKNGVVALYQFTKRFGIVFRVSFYQYFRSI
ncbi:patatin-like phospholipase family protein [Sinorhizobium meliloti]